MKKQVVVVLAMLTGVISGASHAQEVVDLEVDVEVGCVRSPLRSAAWDSPNNGFLASLRANGFTRAQASEIGETVCQDPYLVDNRERMIQRTQQLIEHTPRR